MKKWIKSTLWAFSLTFALSGLSHADIDFSNFHSPSQVDTILNELVAAYPGLAQLSTIGTSHGGMPIKALKISDNVATDESDEGDVLFVAMHHARDAWQRKVHRLRCHASCA